MQKLQERGFFRNEQRQDNAKLAINAFYALDESYRNQVNQLQRESRIDESFLALVQNADGYTPFEVQYKIKRSVEERIEAQPDRMLSDVWFVLYEDGTGLFYSINNYGSKTPDSAIPHSDTFVGYKAVVDAGIDSLTSDTDSPYPYPGVYSMVMQFPKDTIDLDDVVSIIQTLEPTDQLDTHQLKALQEQMKQLQQNKDDLAQSEAKRFQHRTKQVLDAATPYLGRWDRLVNVPFITISKRLLVDRSTADIRILPEGEEIPSDHQYTRGYFKDCVPALSGQDYIEASELVVSNISFSIMEKKKITS